MKGQESKVWIVTILIGVLLTVGAVMALNKVSESKNFVGAGDRIRVTVQLQNSEGAPLSGATVRYHQGNWHDLGTTDDAGQVQAELSAGTYLFRVTHEHVTNEKRQDIAADPVVVFQTQRVVVKLQDSTGAPLDEGVVKYHSGNWHEFGTTSGGEVAKELLSGNLLFRLSHESIYNDKRQDR